MNRLFNAVMSTFRWSPAAAAVGQPRLIAAMEPLEGRQFFSAAPVGSHGDMPSAGPAVHASAKVGETKVTPIAIWNVVAHADGVKGDKKFTISIVSDENGVVTGRMSGDGLNVKDTVMLGSHDSAGYHFFVTTSKFSLNLDGAVGSDGKMTGNFTLLRGSKVMTGTFVASAPAPKPEKHASTDNKGTDSNTTDNKTTDDKKASDNKSPTVHYTVLRRFAGMLSLDGSDRTVAMNVQLCVTSDGVSMVLIQCEAFPVKTFVMMGPKNGDTYTFTGKGEHGSASINFTVSNDSMTGSISRTDDGKTVSGSFTLSAQA